MQLGLIVNHALKNYTQLKSQLAAADKTRKNKTKSKTSRAAAEARQSSPAADPLDMQMIDDNFPGPVGDDVPAAGASNDPPNLASTMHRAWTGRLRGSDLAANDELSDFEEGATPEESSSDDGLVSDSESEGDLDVDENGMNVWDQLASTLEAKAMAIRE